MSPMGSVLINSSPAPAPLLPLRSLPYLFTVGDYAAEGQLGVMPLPLSPSDGFHCLLD